MNQITKILVVLEKKHIENKRKHCSCCSTW